MPPAIRPLLAVLCVLSSVLLSTGCVSGFRLATGAGVYLVLRNNPRLAEPLREINDGVDLLLTSSDAEINDARIGAYVALIASRYGLTEPEAKALTGLLTDLAADIRAGLGTAVLRAGDPRVRPYLRAFHDSVATALTAASKNEIHPD